MVSSHWDVGADVGCALGKNVRPSDVLYRSQNSDEYPTLPDPLYDSEWPTLPDPLNEYIAEYPTLPDPLYDSE